MKRIVAVLASLALAATLTACAKQPSEEISAAKTAVDAAASEGAEKYLGEEYKALTQALATALEEIKVQDGKFLKNYDQAKQKLVQVKADAEALKNRVAVRKDELRVEAANALAAATTQLADASAQLASAPRGKGSLADIEAMKADLAGLEVSLAEVQPLIDAGEYQAALDKTQAVTTQAGQISAEISAARAKMAKR